jgi:phospholipase/carboxylesterase
MSQPPSLHGLHHVTAVTADAPRNLAFYTQVLGMRLVKTTVNQDDVSAYHLFYADAKGSPGTELTFFEWAHVPPAHSGAGVVTETALRIAGGKPSLELWRKHLIEWRVTPGEMELYPGTSHWSLAFTDPEGHPFRTRHEGPRLHRRRGKLGTPGRTPVPAAVSGKAARANRAGSLPPQLDVHFGEFPTMNLTHPSQTLSHAHRYLPGKAGTSAPVLLLLHGTGGDESGLLDLGAGLYPGAALLSPRGQVLEHGMPRFFRRLAEGIFDEADLIARTHALADFVQSAAAHYQFDPARVVALGYSNGANIAAAMLMLRPEILGGAVLLRAMVPLRPAVLPALPGTPVFLASGRHDGMVPTANAELLAATLRRAGASATHHWAEAGHPLTSPEIAATHDWLQTNFPS